jgi:hypothetical protein
MKSLRPERIVMLAIVLASFCLPGLNQTPVTQHSSNATQNPRGVVLEVMYAKGSVLAYQRIGEWTWYEGFKRVPEWKLRPGEVAVAAVKIMVRQQDDFIRARVTVLRGKNHESEEFVVNYTLSPAMKTTIRELADLGIEPFEIQLVQAPATTPEPPTVVNKTKSLEVSVEPSQSILPTFTARIINNSSKPVASFTYFTSAEGKRRMSAQPSNEAGGALIKPGESLHRIFRYPMKTSTASTGEIPPAVPNVVLNVTAVVFSDGSYEGDEFAAANYLAANAGEKALLRRLLDLVQSKEFTNSETEVAAAIAMVNADTLTSEFAERFPTLAPEQKNQLLDAIDVGKSRGIKFFRKSSGEPTAFLVDRMQKRIESLP